MGPLAPVRSGEDDGPGFVVEVDDVGNVNSEEVLEVYDDDDKEPEGEDVSVPVLVISVSLMVHITNEKERD